MKKITRYALHIFHGMLLAILVLDNPWLGMVWFLLIGPYQFLEDWRIRDESYIDWRGYMIGFVLVVLPYLARKYVLGGG